MNVYEMHNLGEAKVVLSMRVQCDRLTKTIYIDQESYIDDTMKHFNMADAIPTRTPIPSGIALQKPDADYKADPKLVHAYQESIGTLIYVMMST